ncbi:MAG: hypothetical protein DCC68_03845 [Planctomycetota bacterium]|nr:MAG: hypothetical protein DCC68_03845 [Planctomycetota bacterium]
MEVYTIGFTQTSAADFFGRLRSAGVRRLVDVRLNNSSQLAAFAKRDDLGFFLRELCGADYVHEPLLAPTQDMLDAYKKQRGDWAEYERRYLDLLCVRKVETQLGRDLFAGPTVLLCSEAEATHCHRRLALDYLKEFWRDMEAKHL